MEYLNANYELITVSREQPVCANWIEVPEGADAYTIGQGFYKNNGSKIHTKDGWINATDGYLSEVVWQRTPSVDANNILTTLNQRKSTYGDFSDVASTTQYLLKMLSSDDMSDVQVEGLHMICSKLARISCGDHKHIDSWHDIAGYAKLVEDSLRS